MRGEVPVPRVSGGWCMRTTRMVLEHALEWPDEELYKRFPAKIDTVTPSRPFWARDVQKSFREASWGVPLTEAQPGDVLAYWRAARNEYGEYVGHIALMARDGLVFENIDPLYRQGYGAFASGALSLTPLSAWAAGKEVEAFRIPEGLV